MQVKKFGSEFRKWSRTIHRELSFFFAGVVLIYAISGFLLNHKRDFNAEYDITRKEFTLQDLPKSQADLNTVDSRTVECSRQLHEALLPCGLTDESFSQRRFFFDGEHGYR